jgi:hypothetical protein
MAYYGPGVDQTLNPTPVPQQVFTPVAGLANTLRLYNQGSSPVFIGGANVSPFNGLPVYPGNRPVEFSNMGSTIYTCSNVQAVTVASGTITSASTAGQNSFVAAASVPTSGFSVGQTFVIGKAGSQEVLTVNTVSASFTTIGTTTNAVYAHEATAPLFTVTVFPSQLRVTAGIV